MDDETVELSGKQQPDDSLNFPEYESEGGEGFFAACSGEVNRSWQDQPGDTLSAPSSAYNIRSENSFKLSRSDR